MDRIKSAYMVTKSDMANQPITFDRVAPVAVFLASDDAVGISGQTISVDGGLWLKIGAIRRKKKNVRIIRRKK